VAEAREIFAAQQDSLRLARLDINFANILFRQDRFADALAAYQRARDALWPDKDAEGIAVVSHNMAVCLISLNDFHRAQAEYIMAREFSQRHNMSALVLQADYNIAYLYYLRGEYRRAIDRLIATRGACRASGDRQHFALCHLDLSEIYLELNLSAEAGDMAETAYQQFQELGMGYEAAKSLANQAIAQSLKGYIPSASELFRQARERFVQEKNRVWPAVIDLYQALVYFHEGRDAEARRLCGSACEHFEESLFSAKAVLAQILHARLALREGDGASALAWCSKAARRAAELGSPNLAYQTSVLMGNVLESVGQAAEAYQSYGRRIGLPRAAQLAAQ
jgi:tetratricopeptide (TPR) repeat protein